MTWVGCLSGWCASVCSVSGVGGAGGVLAQLACCYYPEEKK